MIDVGVWKHAAMTGDVQRWAEGRWQVQRAGISKSEVSRICADLDREIEAFRTRSLTHTTFPYVFCDATVCKVREARLVDHHA